jgi:hypothetical protein
VYSTTDTPFQYFQCDQGYPTASAPGHMLICGNCCGTGVGWCRRASGSRLDGRGHPVRVSSAGREALVFSIQRLLLCVRHKFAI